MNALIIIWIVAMVVWFVLVGRALLRWWPVLSWFDRVLFATVFLATAGIMAFHTIVSVTDGM